VDEIEEEAEAAAAAGLPVELTENSDLPFPIRIAARLDDQIQLDSAALTLGIAGAAEAAGAIIHERSRVHSISHGNPCRLELENGSTLKADRVVLATQMPMLDRGLYFARLRPQASYAVAAPAADAPRGMYLGIGDSLRSIRSHAVAGARRHVIVGGEGHKVGQADGAERYRRLATWLGERFQAAPVTHRWSAHDLMSPDALPMIGALAPPWPRISVAAGFSKWGLAAGLAAADLLVGSLESKPDERMKPFAPARLNARPELPTLVKENANVALHFVGDRVWHRAAPRCTHLGCLLRWNTGDATWDCPCHGSRFAADGSVLNGPATAPLDLGD
jgi:glycine/D-amino acid oxidase-like deaminating enzyme/nitrite reductase/ring-hydroxylating ferredoxin subunit